MVVVIAVGAWFAFRSYEEKQAQALYARGFNVYHGKPLPAEADSRNALIIYKDVVTKYSGSNAANLARYSMGSLYYRLNDLDSAIQAYQDFLSHSGNSELNAMAYSGLGYCYESKGDYAKALSAFQDALKYPVGDAFKGMTYLNMGKWRNSSRTIRKP